MPVITRFDGIVIKMYFRQSEHNPPHVHAIYGEYIGVVDIHSGEMFEGDLPGKVLVKVQQWIRAYEVELLDMWESQIFKKLPAI